MKCPSKVYVLICEKVEDGTRKIQNIYTDEDVANHNKIQDECWSYGKYKYYIEEHSLDSTRFDDIHL